MLPFGNSAHGVRQSSEMGMRRGHRYHSRAWWRRYRARLRRKRAAAALAHRNATLGVPQNIPIGDVALNALPALPNQSQVEMVSAAPAMTSVAPTAVNVTMSVAPVKPAVISRNTSTRVVAASDANAPVTSTLAKLPGQMNLSVVALSRPNPVFLTAREESKMLGGTEVSDLRRLVIDKMIVSGGWVTNDFVRDLNGSRVFVVTARTPRTASSPEKAWTFYFTEADGRIYGLTTDTTVDSAETMSNEAERFINKLHVNSQSGNR